MHCGMCLPTCPTYSMTLQERSSPRGRIALIRAIADGRLEAGKAFADEMYYCLGCLACQTACPAGVDYSTLFETARAEVERTGVLHTFKRSAIRRYILKRLFTSKRRLRRLGQLMYLYQRTGLQRLVRGTGLVRLLPASLRGLEPLTPVAQAKSTSQLFKGGLEARNPAAPRYRVGLLSGCVQDLVYSQINADTIEVLQENGVEVVLPAKQQCCGSLHGHNGEVETARALARVNIDAFDPENLDAVITNAGGCGSHMLHYDHLLAGDPAYAERAKVWSAKVKDIHQYLVEIGFRAPRAGQPQRVTYHDSCHLRHGQKVWVAPRQVLAAIPGLELVELKEADWCCGSAGIYNITQPEAARKMIDRKMENVRATGVELVATANPGCSIQLEFGGRRSEVKVEVVHPISLLAAAYRAEKEAR
ncbi:MAG: (Fe-S)-binding protein [Candidatus Latescibacteria bacterium]|nr:(Fe-S)-binding protein [Candidatus Latescibacterota bacterium]